jgi:hypothetical protein
MGALIAPRWTRLAPASERVVVGALFSETADHQCWLIHTSAVMAISRMVR